MLHLTGGISHFNIGKRIGRTLITHEHGIALGVITCSGCPWSNFDQSAIAVMRTSAEIPFDTIVERVFFQMDHFCSGIGLHIPICQRDRIKFSNRMISLQNAAGIFPSNGCSHFHLGPGNFRIGPGASSSFGNKVINPSCASFRIA